MSEGISRPTWAQIDLDAVHHNVNVLKRLVHPAQLCAVVKADAYGHGALSVAAAAVKGGADCLAVAIVEEGIELREAGVTVPILLLSEPPPEASRALVAAGLTATGCTVATVETLDQAATELGLSCKLHLKVDTGMHRLGARPDEALEVAVAASEASGVQLEGIWTHLAVAEGTSDEDRDFTERQLRIFDEVVSAVGESGISIPVWHAANSAGAIAWPRARYDMVRSGIAVYGELPNSEIARLLSEATGGETLLPVMSLRARVVAVRELEAGTRPSYGRARPLASSSVVATLPIGYADGVPRRYFQAGGEVLLGGRRCPLAGTVTMDQILVDCGPAGDVKVGDEVVLIGSQGGEEITAAEWAERLGTISYEVFCGIGPRVLRCPQ